MNFELHNNKSLRRKPNQKTFYDNSNDSGDISPVDHVYDISEDEEESSEGHGSSKSTKSCVIDTKTRTGMTGSVKSLYQKKVSRGVITWTSKYPSNLEDPVENAKTARYTLLVRYRKSTNSRKTLELDSLVVQSPLIKRVLGSVLENYPGITTSLERLEFEAPFEPFIHRWGRLEELASEEQDPETKKHLLLLLNTLGGELEEEISKIKDLAANGVIDFENLWALFEPGSMLFTCIDGQERIVKLHDGHYSRDRDYFHMGCAYVDWDGERFGLTDVYLVIYSFPGTMAIINLNVYPLASHPTKSELERRLTSRGMKFEAHKGYQYRAYVGIGIDSTGNKYNVDSRVIIDTAAFKLFNPDEFLQVNSIEPSDDDGSWSLDEEKLRMCTASFRAYSLTDKTWLRIFVDNVTEIEWNDHAFRDLVLPENQKELILAFADSQIKQEHQFDDVVRGKGKGIILLLSGPPGVGKTLTAESVAEEMRTPLYMLSAGDLGTAPKEIESSLTRTLSMTTKWKAVLLLDEADVFLESRSTHDLERNKLVSIFLRILEYYQGFLFLTTNRIDDIDAAFESRIHITLQYRELSLSSRQHVWKNFLAADTTEGANFTDADVQRLAEVPMNGRQIKNVLKAAQLLAARQKMPLRLDHVETVTSLRAANARKG